MFCASTRPRPLATTDFGEIGPRIVRTTVSRRVAEASVVVGTGADVTLGVRVGLGVAEVADGSGLRVGALVT
jgi:hypothetical protein